MKKNSILLLVLFILSSSVTVCRVYISEVINNTLQPATIHYSSSENITLVSSKSITTGEQIPTEIKKQRQYTTIMLPAQSIVSLEGAYIPDGTGDTYGKLKTGFKLTAFGGKKFIIRQKNNWIEYIPDEKSIIFTDKNFTRISQENIVKNGKYVLDISLPAQLIITPRTEEKIQQYVNPGNLQPQELLHQAITNNSVEDVKKAIQAGANVNQGIGNQPPLLLAVISEKYKAAEELLNNGANPNITYKQKPLFMQLIGPNKLEMANLFLNKALNLSDQQKQEAINLLLNQPYELDDNVIKALNKLNYNIATNFNDPDLNKNKWYRLLVKHSMGTRQGVPFGHAGLPGSHLVSFFIKNGANSNQIFTLPDNSTWTPLLLIVDSYMQASNQGNINEGHYQSETKKILSILLDAGANINLQATPDNNNETPLSLALKSDTKGEIIQFLVKKGASVDQAINLFLQNGGSPQKEILYPKRTLIYWAVENNNPQAVQLLINAGAHKDNKILQFAISKGHSQIIELLMPN